MSRSRLQKQIGRWKNSKQEITPLLQRYFDRYNFDVGEDTVLRNKLKDKIQLREMKITLQKII